jgi:EAL domain-containing protein (putative c-di-GMP-specific phosphodiesterase class I)
VGTRTLTGFEALARWNKPTRGAVSPAQFIPVAEDIGCIVALGEWVLKIACKEPAPRASRLAAERLELEITESWLLSPDAHVLNILYWFRAKGIWITMNDFGAGYSSLSQLRSFPFNKIKIEVLSLPLALTAMRRW